MNRYELTYIVSPKLDDEARKELIQRFTSLIEKNNGVIESVDENFWGKRKLAYPINDMTEGYYVLTTFKAESDLPKEIERNLQISEDILRYLVIKVIDKKRTVKPRAEKPVVTEEVAETTTVEESETNNSEE